jgi:hypothetical protein
MYRINNILYVTLHENSGMHSIVCCVPGSVHYNRIQFEYPDYLLENDDLVSEDQPSIIKYIKLFGRTDLL